VERRLVEIQGIVQGVGFPPFVYSLASLCELTGFVRNQSERVHIEVEGERVAQMLASEQLPRIY